MDYLTETQKIIMEAIKELSLSKKSFVLLRNIRFKLEGEVPISTIKYHLRILTSEGLVVRMTSSEDSRMYLYNIAEDGLKMIEKHTNGERNPNNRGRKVWSNKVCNICHKEKKTLRFKGKRVCSDCLNLDNPDNTPSISDFADRRSDAMVMENY